MPTIEDLRYLQSQPLDRKIRITQTRIIEWYQRWNGQVHVNFSGGKDSTVLLDIARRIYPDIEAVFVDTGLEYPEIRDFVKTFDNVAWLKPEMNFKQVIEKYGYPVVSKDTANKVRKLRHNNLSDKYRNYLLNGDERGKLGKLSEKWKILLDAPFEISEQCCDVMKKKPAKAFSKKTGKKPIVGTMAYESQRRETMWLQKGCNAFDNKNPISAPMSFWTEQDVLQYLKITNIPYASVYGELVPKSKVIGQLAIDEVPTALMTTGVNRTGCMFCMFGVHLEKEPNRFQRMKITHPKQYDYCIREENGLGLGKVLDYINVKY